jgi:hypothetical protein
MRGSSASARGAYVGTRTTIRWEDAATGDVSTNQHRLRGGRSQETLPRLWATRKASTDFEGRFRPASYAKPPWSGGTARPTGNTTKKRPRLLEAVPHGRAVRATLGRLLPVPDPAPHLAFLATDLAPTFARFLDAHACPVPCKPFCQGWVESINSRDFLQAGSALNLISRIAGRPFGTTPSGRNPIAGASGVLHSNVPPRFRVAPHCRLPLRLAQWGACFARPL